MSLYVDEYLATGDVPGPGHNILTGRYACYDVYRCADDRWVAVGAIEPHFFANLCRALGCEQWLDAPDRRRGAGRDPRRLPRRVRAPGRATSGSRELGPADTCVVAGRDGARAGRRRALPRRAACSSTRDAPERRRRSDQVGWVLAGHGPRPDRRPIVRDATRHRHRRAARARRATRADEIAALREEGVVGVTDDDDLPADVAAADRRGAVRGDRRVPGRAGLHLDDVRVGRERQPAVLGRRRSPTRSPAARSRRRRCSRCGSGRTTGRPAAPSRRCRCRCTST